MSEKHNCIFDVIRSSELATTYVCKWCGKKIEKKIYPNNALKFSYGNPEDLV